MRLLWEDREWSDYNSLRAGKPTVSTVRMIARNEL